MKERDGAVVPILDAHFYSSRVRVAIPFPSWVESDRIGINLRRTERLLSLGGIEHLNVRGQTEGETSQTVPTVVGVHADGSLVGGGAKLGKEVPLYDYQQEQRDGRQFGVWFQNSVWTTMRMNLNLPEMQQRIRDDKGSLRKPEAWAPYLDRSLRDGIRNAGTNHLLRGHSRRRALWALWINVHDLLFSAADISIGDMIIGNFKPHVPQLHEFIIPFTVNLVWWTLWSRLISQNRYRFSLLPGYEIDRAFMLQLLARTAPIIETLPEAPKPEASRA